jgi:hypothetical protein
MSGSCSILGSRGAADGIATYFAPLARAIGSTIGRTA